MRPKPTTEQCAAAVSDQQRVFVVAGPGCGKTTVAAERFGWHRFAASDSRGVLGLSFARSATSELTTRVRQVWGSAALQWPHRVTTIDSILCEIVLCLLRRKHIIWPGGLIELNVLDTWRGQAGCRYLTPDHGYRRILTLNNRIVGSAGKRVHAPAYGIGTKAAFEKHMSNGTCTHDEVRQLLGLALEDPLSNAEVRRYLRDTVRALIVDEVFDANPLDLSLVELVDEAGIPISLIGDPWQALYEFRGARPDIVKQLQNDVGTSKIEVLESFRFRTESMRRLAGELRSGVPTTIAVVAQETQVDVALASKWDRLWRSSVGVIPQSFGAIGNQTDAAMTLLLDVELRRLFRQRAIFAPEAAYLLRLDEAVLEDVTEALRPASESLGSHDGSQVLELLRIGIKDLTGRRPRQLQDDGERRCVERLERLASRRFKEVPLLGLTIHQAKGLEWDSVGLILSSAESGRFAAGLDPGRHADRMLYVAGTRARDETLVLEVQQS